MTKILLLLLGLAILHVVSFKLGRLMRQLEKESPPCPNHWTCWALYKGFTNVLPILLIVWVWWEYVDMLTRLHV